MCDWRSLATALIESRVASFGVLEQPARTARKAVRYWLSKDMTAAVRTD